MSPNWTTEQVLALSPDDSSTKNAKKLAIATKWESLNQNDQAIWGACKGSGKQPYRTQIDLTEPAFKCSCPSRKFPCKHGLGLFLIFAAQPDTLQTAEPPDWVAEWLEKRNQRQQAQAEKKAAPKDPAAQAKRVAKREEKVQAGIADLKRWLEDVLRRGLASVQSESYSFWETPVARLIDAQAAGLARELRAASSLPYSGNSQWPERLLAHLGRLYLALTGYERLESLPSDLQADLRSLVGWTQNQDELLADDAAQVIRDRWCILGKRVLEEERLKVQRTWLWGEQTQQAALLLSFSVANQPFDISFVPGMNVDADLVFFPSAYPQRALVKTRHAIPESLTSMSGYGAIALALTAWRQALARNPWLDVFPMALQTVHLLQDGEQWCVRDAAGDCLPVSLPVAQLWEIVALAGGQPVTVFGEWAQLHFTPLGVFADNRYWGIN
ncbi:MAG: SWIM zinc finger family protein [Thainema sp.]